MATKCIENSDYEFEVDKGSLIIDEIYSKFSIPFIIEKSCRPVKSLEQELKLADKKINKLEKALFQIVGLSKILVEVYKKNTQSQKILSFNQMETLASPIKNDSDQEDLDLKEEEVSISEGSDKFNSSFDEGINNHQDFRSQTGFDKNMEQVLIEELREEIQKLNNKLEEEIKSNEKSATRIKELEYELQQIGFYYNQESIDSLEIQLQSEKLKVIELQETIEILKSELDDSKTIESELKSKIVALECYSYSARLKENEEDIDSLEIQLQSEKFKVIELQETIENLKSELDDSKTIESELKSKITALECNSYSAHLKENEDENDELYLTVQENNESIASLNETISSLNSKISSLQSNSKSGQLETERSNHSSTKRQLASQQELQPSNNNFVAYSSRCQATTLKGAQCKRTAQSGRSYCWQH